ncbi:Ubiquitin-conjugating enzyme E2 S, partial [Bifiguratus adelaidae]
MQVSRELQALHRQALEDIAVVQSDDLSEITAWIKGPEQTPYEGGYFKVKLVLGSDYPNAPPKGYFITKIFHPNVSKTGEVCVNTLKKDWKKELGITHVLLTIKCLLIVPNPESALNEEAGRLLLEKYDDYAKHAKLITSIHARMGKSEYEACLKSRQADCTSSSTSSASYPQIPKAKSVLTASPTNVLSDKNNDNPSIHNDKADPGIENTSRKRSASTELDKLREKKKVDASKKTLK